MNKVFQVFIDGSAGTTGLRIRERLAARKDISLISLPDELRKDPGARKECMSQADAVFLCLPDDAAREAVLLAEGSRAVILDTSTAHRTLSGWCYGLPELSAQDRDNIAKAKRIAVPGCHASGFIALVAPLIQAGFLPKDTLLAFHSLTGYSGGGKKMIAEYEAEDRSSLLDAPREYALGQTHKHLKEMVAKTGLTNAPIFSPIVADFYSGMQVTVPLFASQLPEHAKQKIEDIYKQKYQGPVIQFKPDMAEEGLLSAAKMSGKDGMEIGVVGNEERILLVARYDNLGKGASGAAVQCLNLALGVDETESLVLA